VKQLLLWRSLAALSGSIFSRLLPNLTPCSFDIMAVCRLGRTSNLLDRPLALRNVPAWIMGIGVRPEHIRTNEAAGAQ
jgi:hypothetical protein